MLKKILLPIVAVVFIGVYYWFFMPPLTIAFFTGTLFFGLVILIASLIIPIYFSEYNLAIPTIVGGSLVSIFLIVWIFSWPIFTSTKLGAQLGEPVVKSFKESVSEIDLTQIPVVDNELAKKVGEKVLGENSALGSQVKVGDFTIQNVNGKLFYTASLEHTDYFKWAANTKGTPGYISVSATDPRDVKLVQEIEGKPIYIKYQEGACFGDDLTRHVRDAGYRTSGLTDYSFEIDDKGYPYWVISKYSNINYWFDGETTGVLIVNAQTGKIEEYDDISEVPEWVDRIQPQSQIQNQIYNWGGLVHGATDFSNKDKVQKTNGMVIVYNDGICYYYTGLTSVGADQSSVGYLMINTRTKESTRFTMSGATEDAAKNSIEGEVQNLQYKSSVPIPINMEGIETFFVTLKDKEGLIKKYGMINMLTYSIVGVGDTKAEARRDYMNAMTTTGNNVAFTDKNYEYSIEGEVLRISSKVEGGNTFYYILLKGQENSLFTASSMISDELAITREGDKVKIAYLDNKNLTTDIVVFDNLLFTQAKTEDQIKVEEQMGKTGLSSEQYNKITKVNPEINEDSWNKLTAEQKAELLKKIK